ncbi:SDR family oxidoreductase [Rhodocytophaga rosea]|uniref:SDR family oxidoreductase n=1 Tax=Rhodocytophaga rosea TaxID=2704465 RepID=A0A6C0GRK8_9BACT|nr:SDR family oxidoreductase [Rhodocytophaga rosea]QHT70567.1 SDR family oxidoreductase [Rhodocytophaga rosea]
MNTVKGKNILVIGGSSGIGLAITKQLIDQGAYVITASRRTIEVLTELRVTQLQIDVTGDIQALSALPDVLHGLVYCPGTINLKPFTRLTEEDFMQDMQVNVFGAVRVLQATIKHLKKSSGASVVFFGTVAARTGMNFHASVATAKSALHGLAVSLAAEYASSHIRFNSIAPSLTHTPLAGNLLSTPEKKENADKRHPLGRIGTPEEIASLAVYLLSDQASWITGQWIGMDGGMSTLKTI